MRSEKCSVDHRMDPRIFVRKEKKKRSETNSRFFTINGQWSADNPIADLP